MTELVVSAFTRTKDRSWPPPHLADLIAIEPTR